jgi:hypothetical protein
VLHEAKRCERKYLLTLQQGITRSQLDQMKAAKMTLVVPQSLHDLYPIGATMDVLMTVDQFITTVKASLPALY